MQQAKNVNLYIALAVILLAPGLGASTACAAGDAQYPALISKNNNHAAHGQANLPFLLSLARRPELLDPRYLSFVFGPPDGTKAHSYPSNSFVWTPADGSRTRFFLNSAIDGQTPGGSETRQLVANFAHSSLRAKQVRSMLGKPARRYYDNASQMVYLYQVSPNSTLAVSEMPNTFDVSQLTVRYTGSYLPQVSDSDLVQADTFRSKAIAHHLTKGNRDRGFAMLQAQVSDYPHDVDSRLQLARALRSRCDINSSIAQYRTALSLAQSSGDVAGQKEAIKGLAAVGIVPAKIAIVKAQSLKDAVAPIQ